MYAQRIRLNSLSSILDHKNLHNNGEYHDNKEHVIIENMFKHIELIWLQFSCIYPVKYLHEYKRLEDYCIM